MIAKITRVYQVGTNKTTSSAPFRSVLHEAPNFMCTTNAFYSVPVSHSNDRKKRRRPSPSDAAFSILFCRSG